MQEDLDKILKFQKERNWEKFQSPKNLTISLSIEAAEVFEIFQWTKDNILPEDKRKELKEELLAVYFSKFKIKELNFKV